MALEDGLVLHPGGTDPHGLECFFNACIAGDGLRLVVAGGHQVCGPNGLGQARQFHLGLTMDNPEAAAQFCKTLLHLREALVDEGHTAIAPWQWRQNAGVEDKYGQQKARPLECMGQGSMVREAQVAPAPDQGNHGRRTG